MNSYINKPEWLKNKGFRVKSGQSFLIGKIITGVISLAILILFLNIFKLQIINLFYSASSPISSFLILSGNGISAISEPFTRAGNLKNENNILEKENQKLLSEISLLKEYLKEESDFNKILANNLNNYNLVLGKNIGLDISNDSILIDKGSADGILENMPVVSSEKVLYGKIDKVYKNFSKVMLISNKSSVIDINIQSVDSNIGSVRGVVKGAGNLSAFLDLVEFNAEINEGDILTTSALDGIFPRDFLIGKIIKIDKNDLKPFQTAEIQTFFNLGTIENLFIITNYNRVKE